MMASWVLASLPEDLHGALPRPHRSSPCHAESESGPGFLPEGLHCANTPPRTPPFHVMLMASWVLKALRPEWPHCVTPSSPAPLLVLMVSQVPDFAARRPPWCGPSPLMQTASDDDISGNLDEAQFHTLLTVSLKMMLSDRTINDST